MYQKHGGINKKITEEYGKDILDFSINVNPCGIPKSVRDAIINTAGHIGEYPDPECTKLKEAISQNTGAGTDMILCGNGGSDLINRISRVFAKKNILLPIPSFSEYISCAEKNGCRVKKYVLKEEDGFHLKEDIIDLIREDTALLILTEPNNPTGALTSPELKARILKKCEKTGTILLVDESFIEFTRDSEKNSMLTFAESDNLIILRAFTKYYGLAGLRLGYIISHNTDLSKSIQNLESEWSVSLPAQKAGIAALEDRTWYEDNLGYITRERERLKNALEDTGCKVFPSEADFLLFKGRPGLAEALLEEGILIRDCSSFEGLGPGWYRTAVRSAEDNDRLLNSKAIRGYGK